MYLVGRLSAAWLMSSDVRKGPRTSAFLESTLTISSYSDGEMMNPVPFTQVPIEAQPEFSASWCGVNSTASGSRYDEIDSTAMPSRNTGMACFFRDTWMWLTLTRRTRPRGVAISSIDCRSAREHRCQPDFSCVALRNRVGCKKSKCAVLR